MSKSTKDNAVEIDNVEWHWYKDAKLRINPRLRLFYAPSMKAGAESVREWTREMKRYKMRPLAQEITLGYGDNGFRHPSHVILNGADRGFHVDSVRDLAYEDEVHSGDWVYCVIARWEDWGGTFGENESTSSIFAIVRDDADKAKEILSWLEKYGPEDTPPNRTYEGDMPWWDYGCSYEGATILYLPVK